MLTRFIETGSPSPSRSWVRLVIWARVAYSPPKIPMAIISRSITSIHRSRTCKNKWVGGKPLIVYHARKSVAPRALSGVIGKVCLSQKRTKQLKNDSNDDFDPSCALHARSDFVMYMQSDEVIRSFSTACEIVRHDSEIN